MTTLARLAARVSVSAALASLFFPAARASAAPARSPAAESTSAITKAKDLYQQGHFEAGIELLEPVVSNTSSTSDDDRRAEAALLLTRGYHAIGRYAAARALLDDTLKSKPVQRNRDLSIEAYDLSALTFRGIGQADAAREALGHALNLARSPGGSPLLGSLLNDLGTLQAESGDFDAAIGSFTECSRLAASAGPPELAAGAAINLARTLIYAGRNDGLEAQLAEARRLVAPLPASYPKALHLLSIGSHCWLAQWRFGLGAGWRTRSYEAYRGGLDVARGIGNQRLVSHALGSIGRLYEDEGRRDEALRYTRQAAFVAQEADAADVLYLWQWQAARLLNGQGDTAGAIDGYRNAIRTLRSVRSDVTSSGVAFQTLMGSAFRELADLLLRRASTTPAPDAAQRDLLEVRSTLEELRQAEVAEYFRDDCVVQTPGATQLDQVSKDAAIIYPVVLADRTELLVSLPGGLQRFSVPAGLTELTATVRDFRQKIEVFDDTNGFLRPSRRLYDWLIRPIEPALQRASTRTLVIVPDGPLRTVPLSALNDGSRFLIEKYAVVTSPGLALTSAESASRERVQALAGGLTKSVQGFDPLPNVSSELGSIETTFETTRLQDDRFRKDVVEREVAGGGYSIVHFATHGHFDRDHSRSFLLTVDGQITMDDLQQSVGQRRYRAEAVELLVLSACQTAAGDDRAALGLAGVGLRAGARSVVASLWSISDESTSMLIAELYRQLRASGTTKAEALRAAQLSLLRQEKFRHPYFWAPFLLIGNWL